MLQFGTGKPSVQPVKACHGDNPSQGDNQTDGVSEGNEISEDQSRRSIGALAPSPPQVKSSPVEEIKAFTKTFSPRNSRPASLATGPRLGSRTASPVSFGYPYHQPMENAFFGETHTPTAIRG